MQCKEDPPIFAAKCSKAWSRQSCCGTAASFAETWTESAKLELSIQIKFVSLTFFQLFHVYLSKSFSRDNRGDGHRERDQQGHWFEELQSGKVRMKAKVDCRKEYGQLAKIQGRARVERDVWHWVKIRGWGETVEVSDKWGNGGQKPLWPVFMLPLETGIEQQSHLLIFELAP